MATVRPYYTLVNDPNDPKKKIRSGKPEKDTYLLRWKNYKGIWQTKVYHGDKKSAERVLKNIREEVDLIKAGIKSPPEKAIKLPDAFSEYKKHLKSKNRSPNTIERYERSFEAFKGKFARDIKLNQIKRQDIERFRIIRSGECSKVGVNVDLRQMKAFFSWCYGMEYIQRSPFVGVKIETIEKPIRFLSNDELKALYSMIEGDTKDLVLFYLNSGARAREILPPRFTWINVHQNEITLIGKRNKIRHVALNDMMKEILESRKHLEYPFPYAYNTIYCWIVRDSFNKAGILDANIHTLRKTAGALLIQAGVDVYRVSKFLGHTSVTVTEKHYVDLLKQDYQDISKILEKQVNLNTQIIRTKDTKSDQNIAYSVRIHDDPRRQKRDFKSLVSTNSTTRAVDEKMDEIYSRSKPDTQIIRRFLQKQRKNRDSKQ